MTNLKIKDLQTKEKRVFNELQAGDFFKCDLSDNIFIKLEDCNGINSFEFIANVTWAFSKLHPIVHIPNVELTL